jgi:hypothetical protein
VIDSALRPRYGTPGAAPIDHPTDHNAYTYMQLVLVEKNTHYIGGGKKDTRVYIVIRRKKNLSNTKQCKI